VRRSVVYSAVVDLLADKAEVAHWIASASTSDHHPMPMQATRSGSIAICVRPLIRPAPVRGTASSSAGNITPTTSSASSSLPASLSSSDNFEIGSKERPQLNNLSENIRNCPQHAECGRKAAELPNVSPLRQDFLRLEKRWLELARSFEFSESLDTYTKNIHNPNQSGQTQAKRPGG
jgi:hypothetical protein